MMCGNGIAWNLKFFPFTSSTVYTVAISLHNQFAFVDKNLTCNKPLDLVIALDSSESIREANWTKLIRFTKAVVNTLDPALTRLSVIRYNTNAEVPIPLGRYLIKPLHSQWLQIYTLTKYV